MPLGRDFQRYCMRSDFFLSFRNLSFCTGSRHPAQITAELWRWPGFPSDNRVAVSKEVSCWWATPWVTAWLFRPGQIHEGCKSFSPRQHAMLYRTERRYLFFSREWSSNQCRGQGIHCVRGSTKQSSIFISEARKCIVEIRRGNCDFLDLL